MNNKHIKATCDKCGKSFTIKKVKTKKVGVYEENNVRFSYFNCQHCKEKYFVGVDEKKYNRIQAQIRRNFRTIRSLDIVNNAGEIDGLVKENEGFQKEIKERAEFFKGLFVDWK